VEKDGLRKQESIEEEEEKDEDSLKVRLVVVKEADRIWRHNFFLG
jgi:hypothetical protein